MNELKIFKNEQLGEIRVSMINGEPWFVANDACRILEIANSRDALSRLDKDEKGVVSTDTLGGKQDLNAVNEPGLYSLVLGSRKPEAKQFKRWVTHEVLPTIRQTGAYMTLETIEKGLLNPDTIITLATEIKTLREKNSYQHLLIKGLSRELSFAEMRQVLNRVIKKVPKYSERWSELYKQFNMKFHMNVQQRAKNRHMTNALDYVESIGMLGQLFDIACKFYESEVDSLIQEIYGLQTS